MKATAKFLGLDPKKDLPVIEGLNDLLSEYQVFYQNLRGFHWNVEGENFFTLHPQFEAYYTEAQTKVDEIAERILSLGGSPLHAYSDYLKRSSVKEQKDISNATQCVEAIRKDLSAIIQTERKIITTAEKANDEGTVSMLTDYLIGQEKTLWMLSAYLA